MINLNDIKITTLCENCVSSVDYLAEWGLSIHMSVKGGMDILLDTGKGKSCVPNAEVAGIDLSRLNAICLSHGHFDHTGGLMPVFEKIRHSQTPPEELPVYCHPAALQEQYVKRNENFVFAGMAYQIPALQKFGARFHTSKEPVWLSEDIVLCGEVPLVTDFESPSAICYLKSESGDGYEQAPVWDDQGIFVRTDHGLLVLSGCAHRGIINTLLHAQNITGEDRIHMVVGGTHLVNTSQEQQKRTADMFQELGVRYVGVSHCTGFKPAVYLASRLGMEKFFFNNAGTGISFQDGDINIIGFEYKRGK
jgi:7,8-dihydropterin-6-yl-methyl-4-(beta-D-ribofuranosyl)aminobenzene 5'-phosphate synthase